MAIVAANNPPTPRRCRRMFEAHHLDCQGLSLRQIGARLGRAHSTVHAYLKDFQRHRDHVLRTVAADYLADQLHILTHPATEPDQQRQTVAAIRELRLLLLNLPAIQEPRQPQHDAARINAPVQNLDEPGSLETEPDQHCKIPDDSGPIGTNLDKSEHPITGNPAHISEIAPTPPISPQNPAPPPDSWRPTTPRSPPGAAGPRYPASWPSSLHNPFGSVAPQDADNPPVRRIFGNSRWR